MTPLSILWIDDEIPLLRNFIYRLETDARFRVDTVTSIVEAFNRLHSTSGEWPHFLTIIDINIRPGANELTTQSEAEIAGIGFLERFRERFPASHVIVVSGVFGRLDEESRQKLQGTHCIDKADLFLETIPDHLNKLMRK